MRFRFGELLSMAEGRMEFAQYQAAMVWGGGAPEKSKVTKISAEEAEQILTRHLPQRRK